MNPEKNTVKQDQEAVPEQEAAVEHDWEGPLSKEWEGEDEFLHGTRLEARKNVEELLDSAGIAPVLREARQPERTAGEQ